jgi:hypothetical protein
MKVRNGHGVSLVADANIRPRRFKTFATKGIAKLPMRGAVEYSSDVSCLVSTLIEKKVAYAPNGRA